VIASSKERGRGLEKTLTTISRVPGVVEETTNRRRRKEEGVKPGLHRKLIKEAELGHPNCTGDGRMMVLEIEGRGDEEGE